ncbi:hypothetical protein E3P92_03150, partial [Wallemia ichthyophaga]
FWEDSVLELVHLEDRRDNVVAAVISLDILTSFQYPYAVLGYDIPVLDSVVWVYELAWAKYSIREDRVPRLALYCQMYLWKSTNYAARNYLPHDGCGSKSSRTATTMLPKSVVESAKQAQLNTLKSASAHKLPLLLSKLPHGVGGTRVAQHRWKGVSDEDTFWTVTRCKLRGGGHGSVYGRLTWKGKTVSKQPDELIRGASKYNWRFIEQH